MAYTWGGFWQLAGQGRKGETLQVNPFFKIVSHALLSIGVSGLLLALLFKSTQSAQMEQLFPQLLAVLAGVAPLFLFVYLLCAFVRTFFQTLRYRSILATEEGAIPGFLHMFLVTASRNMFIDLLPARLGELSYVAMLNRSYKVRASSALSSLAIAFLFDLLALVVVIALLAMYQIMTAQASWWVAAIFLLVLFLSIAGFYLLFYGLNTFAALIKHLAASWHWQVGKKTLQFCSFFLEEMACFLLHARQVGKAWSLLFYSLGVRIGKYAGLYSLFYGVSASAFPEVSTAVAPVVAALVSAEAGASLPLPTFMGFGSYEAGGILALSVLGAKQAAALLLMFSLHLLSQIVDYAIGGVAFFIFLLTRNNTALPARQEKKNFPLWSVLTGLFLCCLAIFFFAQQFRQLKMRQALAPPTSFGEALATDPRQVQAIKKLLANQSGFVVWSSNRSGNHDLWQLSLPEGNLKQLTTHPHAEYFPRISPDGNKIVFARSLETWASHRDNTAWQIVLLELSSAKETLLAVHGNVPTWSADGKKVFFQRNGNQFVQLNLGNGAEQVLLESGKNLKVPTDVWLETPSLSPNEKEMAVTLRKGLRETGVAELDGSLRRAGDGCQLSWAPDGSYLYKVDHGGKMQNAFFRIDPRSLKAIKWFDASGEYSHEYFPKVENSGKFLVYGASRGGHEHDKADYEIFLWKIGDPAEKAVRLSFHSGNDNWPDIFLTP